MTCYIYIAKQERGDLLKIGCSRNPEERMRTVKSPNRGGAELVFTYVPRGFWFTVERRAHERLAHRAVGGEWFRITRQEALWAIFSADRDHDKWLKGIGEKTPITLEGLASKRVVFRRKDGIVYERVLPINEANFEGRHY